MHHRWLAVPALAFLALLGCSKEKAERAKEKVAEAIGVAVPVGRDDPAARERERFDEGWRGLEGFRDDEPVSSRAITPAQRVTFAPGANETFEGLDPRAIDALPVTVPLKGDVSGPSVLRTQVYLDRLNFSVGAMDGRWGRNTAIALWWYQRTRGIDAAERGALDEATFRALAGENAGAPTLVEHVLTQEDVGGPFVDVPDDVYEQAKLECLCYESAAERIAERFHATPALLARLNPGVDLDAAGAGTRILVPNVRGEWGGGAPDVARVVISIRGNTFNAFDAKGELVFHAPTTLGSKYDPSPRETVEIVKATVDPWFHYQPSLFHEVPDDDPEAHLPPGPNSPVGVVWIALSKPHYGIHGTSDPESIGYASSHGCVRLTNWDARELAKRVTPKVKVEFRDTARG